MPTARQLANIERQQLMLCTKRADNPPDKGLPSESWWTTAQTSREEFSRAASAAVTRMKHSKFGRLSTQKDHDALFA